MSLKSTNKGGGNFVPVPAGSHGAYCIGVIDLGLQEESYLGGPAKLTPKVILSFETPDEVVNIEGEDKPMIMRQEYTNSLNEKAKLLHHLEAWRGKTFSDKQLEEFDLSTIVGGPCLLAVIHKTSKTGNLYAVITGIGRLPKGMVLPQMVNKPVVYDISQGRDDVFDSLSEFTQKKIEKCDEWINPDGSHDETVETRYVPSEIVGDEPDGDSEIPF